MNLDKLKALISTEFSVVRIDLRNSAWHHGISNRSGWYFIETDTPLDVLIQLPSPPSEYTSEEGELKKSKNYNISARAQALASALDANTVVISKSGRRPVYSGMAKNILSRAREHTFAHQGTAGLALANYEVLAQFEWNFHYLENALPTVSAAHGDITLKLGEQLWRSVYGWPLLCSG